MTGELHRVTELVQTLQKEKAEQHGQLLSGLAEATHATQTLREVLANPKARGQWGERMAEDVLRLSGFVEGVNYRKQTAITGGTIPDFTFFLPNDLLLHMDVKFPVDNYVRCLGADTDADRTTHTNAFLRDVRQRIKDLAARDYIDPQSTVDELLLFIPNESVYAFIHEHDATLVDFALQQRVVLCSPFTLFAVLAVIRQAVDSFMLERTSDEILKCLGSFTDQWGRFSEALDGLGKRMDSAQSAYNELAGTRRRQLQRRLDEIDQLRARRGIDPSGSAEVRALRDVSAG
jgi:DNA recombination protein RmuC